MVARTAAKKSLRTVCTARLPLFAEPISPRSISVGPRFAYEIFGQTGIRIPKDDLVSLPTFLFPNAVPKRFAPTAVYDAAIAPIPVPAPPPTAESQHRAVISSVGLREGPTDLRYDGGTLTRCARSNPASRR